MFRALCNYFDKTPKRPFLGNMLITGLSKWLHNEPAIFSDSPPPPPPPIQQPHFPADTNRLEAIVYQQIRLRME